MTDCEVEVEWTGVLPDPLPVSILKFGKITVLEDGTCWSIFLHRDAGDQIFTKVKFLADVPVKVGDRIPVFDPGHPPVAYITILSGRCRPFRMTHETVIEMLNQVYDHCEVQETRSAVKVIMRGVNDLLHASRFDLVDETFRKIDQGRISLHVAIGLLRITGVVRDYLSEWKPFLAQIETIQECVDHPSILIGLTEPMC